ncbi:MAG: hypothetical protein GX609_08460 [Actinomycetales bacterium]|nr:hypothetical protein [Actinomycetales bacterium]
MRTAGTTRPAARTLVALVAAAVVATTALPAVAGPVSFAGVPSGAPLAVGPADGVGRTPNDDVPVGVVPDGALPAEPAPTAEDPGAPIAFAGAVTAPPTKTLPPILDANPGWQPSVSCDPTDKPGVVAFAKLVATHWGKTRYHTSRQCVLGDGTQHAEGRALDWTMNAYDAGEKLLGDAVVAWITANNGEMARRFGIMYLIWNRKIWYSYRPTVFESYTGPVPHTDHIHFSFTWDGAMGRTSWWTGVPVTTPDVGPCRVYKGQYAPRYTGPRTTPCPTTLLDPPYSAYPVTLPGATGATVSLAQALLGLPVDGTFGAATLTRLLAYQKEVGVPVTGVLDNATWAKLVLSMPVPPYRQIVGAPDLTGDGYADLATVDDRGRLSIFPGIGGGKLGPVRPFGTGWAQMRVYAPGDWNRDGRGDIVAADAAGDLWLYAGDGKGRFPSRAKIGNGWNGYRITPAGDVSGDRVPDLLAIDPRGDLYLYPGNGRGGFGKRLKVGNGWNGFELYAAGDQNRDGRADILGIDSAGKLWFYAGRGGGYFAMRVQVGHGWTGYTFASGADLDRDGIGDLVGRDPDGVLWFYAGRPGMGFWQKRQIATGW